MANRQLGAFMGALMAAIDGSLDRMEQAKASIDTLMAQSGGPVYRFGTVLEHNMTACAAALAAGMGGCEACRWVVTPEDPAEDPAWELGAGPGLPPGSEPVDYADGASHGRGMAGDPCGPP